jgi:hypothetical protein
LRFDLGQKLAQFDLAMLGFEHPAAHRRDLTRSGRHRERIALIDDPGHPNGFVSVPPAWRLLEQLRDSTIPGS